LIEIVIYNDITLVHVIPQVMLQQERLEEPKATATGRKVAATTQELQIG
jgi:hypothetical protein